MLIYNDAKCRSASSALRCLEQRPGALLALTLLHRSLFATKKVEGDQGSEAGSYLSILIDTQIGGFPKQKLTAGSSWNRSSVDSLIENKLRSATGWALNSAITTVAVATLLGGLQPPKR